MSKYKIEIYIPVDTTDHECYDTFFEAQREVEQLRLMNPENLYSIALISPPQEERRTEDD